MKCDELEIEYVGYGMGFYPTEKVDEAIDELKDELNNQKWRGDEWARNANDKDRQIVELKSENERLKATPEEIMKEVFDKVLIYPHDMVRLEDAYRLAVSLRKTKRALWLARAEWARSAALSYHLLENHPNKDVAVTYKRKANRWEKTKDKCRAKAEEYK